MFSFLSPIPLLYRWTIGVALLTGVMLYLRYEWIDEGIERGKAIVQTAWNKDIAARAEAEKKTKKQQVEVTATAEASALKQQAETRTVFRDRIIYQDREVPREVIIRQDAACTVPNRFVILWNSANRAELPSAASLVDESASGVTLSDISTQKEREAELCHNTTNQLIGLQQWVNAQQQIKPE